jgi:hypothetical protein
MACHVVSRALPLVVSGEFWGDSWSMIQGFAIYPSSTFTGIVVQVIIRAPESWSFWNEVFLLSNFITRPVSTKNSSKHWPLVKSVRFIALVSVSENVFVVILGIAKSIRA